MRYNRLQPLAVYITTMGMELCCLYLALLWVMEKFGPGYITITLILTVYPATLFLRLLFSKSAPGTESGRLPIVFIGISVTALIAGLSMWAGSASQPAFGQQDVLGLSLQVVLLAIAGWLGFNLASSGIDYRHICFRFQIGILAMLVLSMLTGQVFWPVVIFFTLAILALILARWETSVSTSRGTLKSLPPGKIILGSLAVLLPVTGLFFILSTGAVGNIVDWMSEVGEGVDSFIKSDTPAETSPAERFQFSCAIGAPEIDVDLTPETPPPDSPGGSSPVSSWLVLLIISLSILAIILFTIWKRRARLRLTRLETTAEVETTKVSASLTGELGAFFKGIGKWLWRALLSLLRLRSDTSPLNARGGEPGLSVRVLYCRLLDWAAKRDLPRTQSQTPLEYLKVLCQKFPEKDKELAFITGVYLRVRYGQHPVSETEVDAVGQAWQMISLSP